MFTRDAIAHYGSKVKLAEALGYWPSSISQWGEIVPEASANRLVRLTNGALEFVDEHYPLAKKPAA